MYTAHCPGTAALCRAEALTSRVSNLMEFNGIPSVCSRFNLNSGRNGLFLGRNPILGY